MRLVDVDELIVMEYGDIKFVPKEFIDDAPTVDAVEVIRCKDCIHKPKPTEDYKQGERDNGFEIEFPDYMCPLQCDDAYYSRLPKDDWFCGNAERRNNERSNQPTSGD